MRDARINPVAGDVLTIGMKQWKVTQVSLPMICVVRDEVVHSQMWAHQFRSFFKLASTVRYGDEA
ncbi:MAG: hypothetical protein [Bacteriophage sp.]|nr:MAG: hypothetical protein [Bacteriophage sp.]